MYLKSVELTGFKSFGKKTSFEFTSPITAIVGPNGAGKCVTGDTCLRRRVRANDRESLEDVAIVDIRQGDEVLTLDEKRGQLIVSRVNALQDMGTKDIVEIVTATGKRIRTTDTHPYLALAQRLKHPRVAIFIDGANFEQSVRTICARADFSELQKAFPHSTLRLYQTDFGTPAQARFFTRLKKLGFRLVTKSVKVIRRRDGRDAHKSNFDVEIAVDAVANIDFYDVAVLFSGDSDFDYLVKHLQKCGKEVVVISPWKRTARELRQSAALYLNLKQMPFIKHRFNPVTDQQGQRIKKAPEGADHDRLLGSALPILEQVHPFVKGGEWISAKSMKAGDMIATANENGKPVYERIINVHLKAPERVYDIEVEGTHNFVANGIIAHNSNVAEAFRFVLGEQSMKSLRSKRGEDLIWGGSPALPRMNRAGIRVVFDNTKRLLDIDFPEVTVERVVFRDGQNEYLLNGTQVRLKDVVRLLAGANIGGSGYQIISQGEADRILNASPKERREMVEDSLGLKLYQHKKAESERKLDETAVNIDKTKSLRRELAPHLKFLQTQVEKVEKARDMKEELKVLLLEYLAREHAWLTSEHTQLFEESKSREAEARRLELEIKAARGEHSNGAGERAAKLESELREMEHKRGEARKFCESLARELGRAEGALEATNVTVEQIVPVPHVRQFIHEIESAISDAERADDVGAMRGLLSRIRERIKSFVGDLTGVAPITNHEAKQNVDRLASQLKRAEEDELKFAAEAERIRVEIAQSREEHFNSERKSVELEGSMREAQGKLGVARSGLDNMRMLRQRFEEEVREGVALIGADIRGWDEGEVPQGALSEDRSEQDKRRRAVERLKIKIEEAGIGGGDAVVKEFSQTRERDEFLARELADLEKSAASLKDIIAELEKTIDQQFTEGLKHINKALTGFFSKLFGGGEAKLEVEESRRMSRRRLDIEDETEEEIPEEDELYAGLSISVKLPRKKVHGLEVLSGGERALTSIALIFSMSQVNPPPFLILDETDAALDEANSKRYADMVQELAEKSQLIVITHNRATMAAAGELYGVTMDSSGVSKVLSVKLEDAEHVAK